MEWVNLGFDVRVPLSRCSEWKAGDLGFQDFVSLVGEDARRISKILSFDLNLSPQPNLLDDHALRRVGRLYGGFATEEQACVDSGCTGREGVLVFWQVEEVAFLLAKNESWFNVFPEREPALPDGWGCVGIDVVNDEGLSELWDPFEQGAFWSLDEQLAESVNSYGLITNEEILEKCLSSLPISPADRWAMPVRIWVQQKDK